MKIVLKINKRLQPTNEKCKDKEQQSKGITEKKDNKREFSIFANNMAYIYFFLILFIPLLVYVGSNKQGVSICVCKFMSFANSHVNRRLIKIPL